MKALKEEYPDIYKQADDYVWAKFDSCFSLGTASQSLAEAEGYCMDTVQRINYGQPVLTAANVPEPWELGEEEG